MKESKDKRNNWVFTVAFVITFITINILFTI